MTGTFSLERKIYKVVEILCYEFDCVRPRLLQIQTSEKLSSEGQHKSVYLSDEKHRIHSYVVTQNRRSLKFKQKMAQPRPARGPHTLKNITTKINYA